MDDCDKLDENVGVVVNKLLHSGSTPRTCPTNHSTSLQKEEGNERSRKTSNSYSSLVKGHFIFERAGPSFVRWKYTTCLFSIFGTARRGVGRRARWNFLYSDSFLFLKSFNDTTIVYSWQTAKIFVQRKFVTHTRQRSTPTEPRLEQI
jgi:hypothetical protein